VGSKESEDTYLVADFGCVGVSKAGRRSITVMIVERNSLLTSVCTPAHTCGHRQNYDKYMETLKIFVFRRFMISGACVLSHDLDLFYI